MSSKLVALALGLFSTPRLNKVVLVKKKDNNDLLSYFDKKVLPKNYGGLKVEKRYWPPDIIEVDYLTRSEIYKKGIQVFTMLMSEEYDCKLFLKDSPIHMPQNDKGKLNLS